MATPQATMATPSDRAGGCRFMVAQNDRGYWVARANRGVIEGVFRSRREAIRFALFETGSRAACVVVGAADAAARH